VLVASRRLPGIEVGVTPRPAAEALPRMDVAVLVGFASTGPVHTPIAVESVARFTEVFGTDAPLAWDDTRGERVHAYLGPAVRAFFANGGRRCWIIRVARAPIANDFAIPGVLSVALDGTVETATATARSEGSWSDGLRVASALQTRSIAIVALSVAASPSLPASESIFFGTRVRLGAGDLVEIGDGDRSVFAAVRTVTSVPDADGVYDIEADVCATFERLAVAGSPWSPPGWPGTADVHGVGGPIAATLLAPTEPSSRLPFDAPVPAELIFHAPIAARLERGQWVRWSDGSALVWLRIDRIEDSKFLADSPPGFMLTKVFGPAWRLVDALSLSLADVTRARVLSLELRVESHGDQVARLVGVGLTPAHPAAWWNQSTDADFYARRDELGRETPASQDRRPFPLARVAGPVPRAWIPLGVSSLFGAALSPLTTDAPSPTALERDGLSQFDADLFLDPELADVPMNGVAELADAIRFVRDVPRPLRGLHAAWSLGEGGLFNEGSLLAIPDAIHLGWQRRPEEEIPAAEPRDPEPPPHWHTHRGVCATPIDGPADGPDFGTFLDCATRALTAPVLEGPSTPVPPGVYRLTWTDSVPQGSYVLNEYTQADLSDPHEIARGTDTEYTALTLREGVYYYQVFARDGDERSDGSNVVAVRVRADDWVQKRPGRDADEALDRQLLAIHRAALRMAGASGDLFVALAMPRHFRSEQAIRYAQRLREIRQPPGQADVDAFGFTETRALSYGALYFPWLQSEAKSAGVRSETSAANPPKVVPPDGVALGVLAARAANRGAWIAPANEPLQDIVAVAPPVAAADWQALLDAQINLVRADPRGFMTLSADTLALDVAVRPINVRRLLILLRRLALRRGVSYVFEPNAPALRRAVQRGFELLLTDLFDRGAFAGAIPEQSFRVVTDGTINTRADAEAGRFLVELRVAPSVPMRFIGVQLAQSGARLTVSEEL
jgi:hypothetical protein